MNRRNLLTTGLGAALSSTVFAQQNVPNPTVFIERAAQGSPQQGKTFALITPHLDDGPIFAGGTVAKLLREGYTGYFISHQ